MFNIRRKEKAFTILELLLASAIFLIILVMVTDIFVRGLDSANHEKKALYFEQNTKTALQVMASELREGYKIMGPADTTLDSGSDFIAFKKIDPLYDDENPDDATYPVVAYRIVNRQVYRTCSPGTPSASIIAENVSSLNFRYVPGSMRNAISIRLTESDPDGKLPPFTMEVQVRMRNISPTFCNEKGKPEGINKIYKERF